MKRLILVDDAGGRLAMLAAGMAQLEGVDGFAQVVACAQGEPADGAMAAEALREVGLQLAPSVQNFSTLERRPEDLVVAIGRGTLAGASQHWPSALVDEGSPALARRASLRIERDALARRLTTLAGR